MAITSLAPEVQSDITTVYIVRVDMNGGSNISERTEIDQMSEKVTHVFDKDTRQKISAVRSKYYGRIVRPCLSFYGLLVAKREQQEEIEKAITEAHTELQAIHQSLQAKVAFIPLVADQQSQGALYRAMVDAIRGQIYKILLPRLRELAKQTNVPKRSRMALLDLCDKMAGWNVLGDAEITKTVADLRRQFENDVIAPVAIEVEQELRRLMGPAGFVEFPEDATPTAPPTTPNAPQAQ